MTSQTEAPALSAEDLDAVRRAYWSQSLDQATEFMRRAVEAPVAETLEPAVDLVDALPAGLDVEFAGSDSLNSAGLYFLRASLVPMLVEVIKEMNGLGLGLRIEFGYRTPEMQAHLCRSSEVLGRVLATTTWEAQGRPDTELVYRRLAALCANVYKTGTHLGASALDVSLLDRETGQPYDRGGDYLTLDVVTPFESPHISTEARRHRALVRGVFSRHGFVAYPYEFWHFSAGDVYEALVRDTRQPARYGPVHVDTSTGSVVPVDQPDRELVPKAAMLERIEQLLNGVDSSRE